MPLLTISTSDIESRIRLVDTEDNLIFEDEVIYIDHLLSLAQRGADLEDDNSVCLWLPLFTERLNAHYQTEIEVDETTAFFIAKEAVRLMWAIKKKCDSTLTLQEFTESTPST